MDNKKSNRGGARVGSGRKKGNNVHKNGLLKKWKYANSEKINFQD